jgi:hypothetical protein
MLWISNSFCELEKLNLCASCNQLAKTNLSFSFDNAVISDLIRSFCELEKHYNFSFDNTAVSDLLKKNIKKPPIRRF